MRTMIFDDEHTMARRPRAGVRIAIARAAVRARTMITLRDPRKRQWLPAEATVAWMLPIFGFAQFSTLLANKDVPGMAFILSNKVAREEGKVFSAATARLFFHPEKIFHLRLRRTALKTPSSIEMADLVFEPISQLAGSLLIRHQVQMFDLLTNDPVGHRVNVVTNDIASNPVSFDKRSSPAHEGVSNTNAFEIIGSKKGFF